MNGAMPQFNTTSTQNMSLTSCSQTAEVWKISCQSNPQTHHLSCCGAASPLSVEQENELPVVGPALQHRKVSEFKREEKDPCFAEAGSTFAQHLWKDSAADEKRHGFGL